MSNKVYKAGKIWAVIIAIFLTLGFTYTISWWWALAPIYVVLILLLIIGIYMYETGDLDDLPPFTFKRGWINFKYWIKRKFKK